MKLPWWGISAVLAGTAMAITALVIHLPFGWLTAVAAVGAVTFVAALLRHPAYFYRRMFSTVLGIWAAISAMASISFTAWLHEHFGLELHIHPPGAWFHVGGVMVMALLLVLDYLSRQNESRPVENGPSEFSPTTETVSAMGNIAIAANRSTVSVWLAPSGMGLLSKCILIAAGGVALAAPFGMTLHGIHRNKQKEKALATYNDFIDVLRTKSADFMESYPGKYSSLTSNGETPAIAKKLLFDEFMRDVDDAFPGKQFLLDIMIAFNDRSAQEWSEVFRMSQTQMRQFMEAVHDATVNETLEEKRALIDQMRMRVIENHKAIRSKYVDKLSFNQMQEPQNNAMNPTELALARF